MPKEEIAQTAIGTHKAVGQIVPRVGLKKELPMNPNGKETGKGDSYGGEGHDNQNSAQYYFQMLMKVTKRRGKAYSGTQCSGNRQSPPGKGRKGGESADNRERYSCGA